MKNFIIQESKRNLNDCACEIDNESRLLSEKYASRLRIGKRIKELRESRGVSSYKLAELTGLHRPHISAIEAGKYSVGVDVLSKIADALGYEVDFVKKKSDEKTS